MSKEKEDPIIEQVLEHIPGITTFLAADGEGVEMPHDDVLVEAIIHNLWVQKIPVDNGSKVNLLPYRIFQAMKILEENMIKDQSPVKEIRGVPILVEGKVKLLLTQSSSNSSNTICSISSGQATSIVQCNTGKASSI